MSYKSLLYGLVTILLTLALLEGMVRIWGYSDRYMYDPIYASYDKCDTPLVVHKPNLQNALARANTLINTDSLGLRSLVPGRIIGEKPPNTVRIAIAGDSVTFGHGIRHTADVYPNVLEGFLNSVSEGKTNYEVYNFGVSAYSLAEMTATLKCRMLDIKPDIVVCAFILDDFDPGRMVSVDEYGYTNDRKLAVDSGRFPALKRFLRHFHLTYLIRDAFFAPKQKESNSYDEALVSKSYPYLQEFRKIASEKGIPYFFILLPSYGSEASSKIAEKLGSDGFNFLDLSTLWAEYKFEDYRADKYDAHPSAAVHKQIAERAGWYIKIKFGS